MHDRWTACALHYHRAHQGDWRDGCSTCEAQLESYAAGGNGARGWLYMNGYNFTPGLPANVALRGAFITEECAHCAGRVLRGYEGYGFDELGDVLCQDCKGKR